MVVLGAAAAAAAYFLVIKPPGDISNPNVPFIGPSPTPAAKTPKTKVNPDAFVWPNYGYTSDHRRQFGDGVNGPFRVKWLHRAPALTEFPPAISKGRIFQLADNGRLVAMKLETGKILWRRGLGSLSASSPAVVGGRVYVTILEGARGSGRGRIVCLREQGGKVLWSHTLPSRSESSPLVDGGRVYFGSEGGTVYGLDARTGHQDWTYQAAGPVKGSPTLSDGLLYFGDYGGQVQAVRARDGAKVWTSSAGKGLVRSGHFYATAAVAFGRVYIGSTDGRAYSFSAKDGRVAWAHQTGRYVYSSAAVDNVNGAGPMVFFGSYDGTFYALDARSGRQRWTFRSGGKISGSPTIVGDTVYFSDLGRSMTFGLKTRGGKLAFRYKVGAYDPIVSDGTNLYLTGNRSLTALQPRRLYQKLRSAKQKKVRNKKALARKLVSPAWPSGCRQLAPCGPLTAVRNRRTRLVG